MSEKISLKDQTTEPERDDSLSYREKPNFSPTANSSHDISFLQKTIGNRALFRLFKSGALQPKLKIGQPKDTYEQEADRVAGQVIGNNYNEKPNLSNTTTTIQRSPAEGETTTTTEPVPEVTQPPSPVSTTQPEETKTPTPGLIVEDSATELLPGQMKRSEFLAQLRAAVCSTAEAALSGSRWSEKGCPWIDHWFGYYAGRDSQSIERAIQRYTGASGVGSAADYIPIICLRVQIGIAAWRMSGEVKGAPEAAPTEIPGTASEGGAETPPSTTDSIDFKSRGNSAKESVDPKSVQSQLDTGHSLDSNTKSKMETAFGQDFSDVKIHTDSKASQLSDDLNARAFTIGKDVAFGSGEYQPGTLIGDALIAHELAHTVQQGGGSSSSAPMQKGESQSGVLEEDADTSAVGAMVSLWGGIKGGLANIARNAMPRLKSGLRLQRCATEKKEEGPSDIELISQIDMLRDKLANLPPDSPEAQSIQAYVSELERFLIQRRPTIAEDIEEKGAYPKDVALFTTYLLRSGYIRQVAGLLPPAWRTMSEAELTSWLSQRFTENELKAMFLEKYEARAAIKARFRKLNIVGAIVIGLIWAQNNITEGEWGTAAAKVGATGFTAWAFNKLLYARDPAAAAIMQRKALEFGRWFKGAARTNKVVNFLVRKVGTALLIWDLKDIFMSGGYDGPNIPFDLIVDIDIDDPSTWVEPDQTLLDFGFNIWYRQKCTTQRPETCVATPLYVGKIEGSALKGIGKLLDIAPRDVPGLRKNLYRIEGDYEYYDFFIFGYVARHVSASENVLVISTGELSGEMVSGRGHYRMQKVIPANEPAWKLLGSQEPKFVPEYVLHPVGL